MPKIIVVGFQTRLVPGMTPDPATLTPPATHKNEDAIAKWRGEQAIKIKEQSLYQPYTATFDTVTIMANKETGSWNYRDQSQPNAKQPAPLAIWAWINKKFPQAWPHTTHPRWPNNVPPVILVGFNTRLFIKIMAAECAKPANQPKMPDGTPRLDVQNTLPLSFWYNNSEHRDIAKAAIPEGYKYIDWPTVLKHFDLQKQFPNWKEPHQDAVEDLGLTLRLADALGMLTEDEIS